uniref:Uncharacterized protein n=1 Tax=Glossina brevipalpis TaxID=37001 RepID=A0A1A9WS64_9MUSC
MFVVKKARGSKALVSCIKARGGGIFFIITTYLLTRNTNKYFIFYRRRLNVAHSILVIVSILASANTDYSNDHLAIDCAIQIYILQA